MRICKKSVNGEINHVLMGDLCNKKMRRDEFKTKELKLQEKEHQEMRRAQPSTSPPRSCKKELNYYQEIKKYM